MAGYKRDLHSPSMLATFLITIILTMSQQTDKKYAHALLNITIYQKFMLYNNHSWEFLRKNVIVCLNRMIKESSSSDRGNLYHNITALNLVFLHHKQNSSNNRYIDVMNKTGPCTAWGEHCMTAGLLRILSHLNKRIGIHQLNASKSSEVPRVQQQMITQVSKAEWQVQRCQMQLTNLEIRDLLPYITLFKWCLSVKQNSIYCNLSRIKWSI